MKKPSEIPFCYFFSLKLKRIRICRDEKKMNSVSFIMHAESWKLKKVQYPIKR